MDTMSARYIWTAQFTSTLFSGLDLLIFNINADQNGSQYYRDKETLQR